MSEETISRKKAARAIAYAIGNLCGTLSIELTNDDITGRVNDALHFAINEPEEPMTEAKIIGISGKRGSGKDTLADHLMKAIQSHQPYHKSYAHKLKMIVAMITGEDMTQQGEFSAYDDTKTDFTREQKAKHIPAYGKTLGEILQVVGTEGMRQGFHEEVWVNSLFANYNPAKKMVWIISDVRFPNEAEAIKSRGGIIIRLVGDPKGFRTTDRRDGNHASETALDQYKGFDYTIETENVSLEDYPRVMREIKELAGLQ